MNLVKKLTYAEAVAFVNENDIQIKKYYLEKDLSARRVAERLNIFYDNNFQKALIRRIGKKEQGLGGARENSGNKKGVQWCKVCRKKIGNCEHYLELFPNFTIS